MEKDINKFIDEILDQVSESKGSYSDIKYISQEILRKAEDRSVIVKQQLDTSELALFPSDRIDLEYKRKA